MSILFTRGVNDSGKARVKVLENGRMDTCIDGSCNVLSMLDFAGVEATTAMFYGKGMRKKPVWRLRRHPSLIFNEISDADTHQVALRHCGDFCAYAGVPVINPPDKILCTTRDEVANRLQGIPGVRMPRTTRFQADAPEQVFQTAESQGFEPPFIVRIAGDHGGKSMVRLSGPDDLDRLHVFPFGDTVFYLTEFVDYANRKGEYHKQRIVMVDGEPIARHSLLDTNWNVHAASRNSNAFKAAGIEADLARTTHLQEHLIPKASAALEEIWRRLQLDYYGIDCCLTGDGQMLIFEVNANMNILLNRVPQLEPRVALIKDRICALMTQRSGEAVTWVTSSLP